MKPGRYFYAAFGLSICSDIPVMEFVSLQPLENYEIRIRAERARPDFPLYQGANHSFRIDKEDAILYFSGVGEYRICAGRQVTIIPAEQATSRTIELYLSGVVFAVLLYLRGLLVYHGSCVAHRTHGAVALVGDSGAGKSTLAAVLQQRGYGFLSDDVVALDIQAPTRSISVYPGFPLLKISPELAARLQLDSCELLAVQEGESKAYLPVCGECGQGDRGRQSGECGQGDRERGVAPAFPLGAICFLEVGEERALERLSARETMIQSIRYTMPTRLLQQSGEQAHFQQCALVARSVPAYRFARRLSFQELEGDADLLEQYMSLKGDM
ncbi:phosphoenolpyruvate carboxykinase (ATP) [Desulfogranum mediterraneum]|uniref:hypothetical protein n=1 Tax=Desulfogranum mediterraneum TaxID=160661 RepID=UPI0003FF0D6B|nr:hypothetical protein [Desulfogranum mediterraneum]